MISWKLKSSSCRPIGLDIGHSSIKMIQLGSGNGQMSVLAADEVRFDSEIGTDAQARRDFIVSAIKDMLTRGDFRGKNVVSGLSNDSLKIKRLRLDTADEDRRGRRAFRS